MAIKMDDLRTVLLGLKSALVICLFSKLIDRGFLQQVVERLGSVSLRSFKLLFDI